MIKSKSLSAIFIFLVLYTFSYSQDKVHTVLVLKDWKPYYSLDKNGKPTGYSIELFETLANDIGLKYQYKTYDNWAQMVPLRKSQKEYIIPNTGFVKMRADYTLYSHFTDTFQIKFFKRKKSFNISQKKDLQNKNIAVVENNICVKLLNNQIGKKIIFKDRYAALSALISGEVDALCYPKFQFNLTLKAFNLENEIIDFEEPLEEIKRGLGFSLNNTELIPLINASLEKLKKEGTYQKIYQKWFTQNDEITFTYEQIVFLISFILSTLLFILFCIYYITRKNRWLLTKKELEDKLSEKTEELSLSLDRYNKALSATEEGIWDWDVTTNKVYYSPTWKTMLGYTPNEIKNEFSEWKRLIHPKDFEESNNTASKLANGQLKKYSIECRMLCKNGTYRWILSRAKIIELTKDNKPKRIIGIHIDLTKQKERELLLIEEKEKFEAIFKNSNDGIAIFDLESRFLEFNDAYTNMLGYSRKELKNTSCIELTPKEHRETSVQALKSIIQNGYIENFEKKCVKENGTQITVNMTANLLPDKKRIIAVSKNVSSLKLIEEQERLISMGELIGNISHQWRQPLTTITMAANNIKLDNALNELKSETINELMDSINKNAQYLSQTIETFRNYLKENKEYSQINIHHVLKESLSLTESSRKSHFIHLISDITEDITLSGIKNELQQAFINILNNAKDALSTHNNTDDDKYIFVSLSKVNDQIEITFLDNGGGIKQEIITKIFEPYFTTKHQDLGTGLGLSIAEKIIREHHNGILKVENKEFVYNEINYKGACFTIHFTEHEHLNSRDVEKIGTT